MIGTFNENDPLLQVEFEKARQTLVEVKGARRLGLRKRPVGRDAVQIVLVERTS